MKSTLLIILLSSCCNLVYGQTLLCSQDPVTVHYVTNKSEDGPDFDEWRIYLDIVNRGKVDLFYSRPYKGSSMAGNEMIPSYLVVNVLNGIGTHTNQTNYIHGGVTLHVSADTLTLYKISTKHYDKSITTRTRKGDPPQISGSFMVTLLPLDSIKQLKFGFKR